MQRYISQKERSQYDNIRLEIERTPIQTKGDLEYLIYSLMRQYMATRENRYSNLHDTVYAAMHCADEYRRRYLDKREDEAIAANGDI